MDLRLLSSDKSLSNYVYKATDVLRIGIRAVSSSLARAVTQEAHIQEGPVETYSPKSVFYYLRMILHLFI